MKNNELSFARPEETIQVLWEFWRAAQQRSYHGPPAIVDLTFIGDVDLAVVNYDTILAALCEA